jgi:hypothetical protein
MFGVKKYARGAAENSRPYFEKAVGSEDDDDARRVGSRKQSLKQTDSQ